MSDNTEVKPKVRPAHLYQKGQSGNPAGKPKGMKDKRRFDFAMTCFKENFNPCLELIKIVRTAKSDHARVQACAEIASYVAPKLRSVEISTDDYTEKFQLNFNVIKTDDRLHSDEDGK